MPGEKVQYWLADLDQYGNPTLVDGAHSDRGGAEEAATLLRRLGLAGQRNFAVAEIRITALTGEHGTIDEQAIGTLNAIGLRPHG